MLKALISGISLAISAGSIADSAQPGLPSEAAVSLDEAVIRATRNELNTALVSRDLAAISKYWLQDAQSVFAGGEVRIGRDKIIERYAKIFQGGAFLAGVRKPERIDVATGGPGEAAESGAWEWRMRQSGQDLTYRGRYLAMWLKVGGHWFLRSDLYVTTACTGGNACT